VTADTLVVAATAKVTVTGEISVDDVNAIADETSGVVTATLTTGNLASYATLAETGNVYTVTVSDAEDDVLTAVALSTLGGKTTGVVTVSNAVEISGTAAEVTAALVTEDTLVVAATAKVTVTGEISVSEVNAIADTTDGVVTATLTTGNLASYATLAETGNAYTVTVSDASDEELTAADLSTLGGKTTGVVTVSNAVEITGTSDDVTAALVTEDTLVVAATAKVSVSGEISVADLNAIAGTTSGVVTASISDHDITILLDLSDSEVNAYTISISDSTTSGADLNTLDAITSVTVNALSVSTITGSLADVLTATENQSNIDTAANVAITLSAGTATAAELNTLNGRTTGVIDATAITGITGSPTEFDTLLAAITGGQITVADNFNAVVTGEPSVAQLAAVNAENGTGTLTYTTVKDIATVLVNNAGSYVTDDVDAVISDSVSLAQMASIEAHALTGSVSVGPTGKISDIFANLLNDRLLNGASGLYVTDAVPLVEVSVSVSLIPAADADVLAQVANIAMASGAILSVTDTASNIASTASAINDAFGLANVVLNATGAVSTTTLNAIVDLGSAAGNIDVAAASFTEYYSIANATWAAQHGYLSTMSVWQALDYDIAASTLQSINVTSLNAEKSTSYTFEGLLKSVLNAGWTNVEYTGGSAGETLSLTGYPNVSRSLKLYMGDGVDTVTGTTSADQIYGQAGNDVIEGGTGADTIDGGTGVDRITGGTGADTMTGGSDADTFVFIAADSGTISGSVFDTINDYVSGTGGDKLDLVGVGVVASNVSGVDVSGATVGEDVITGLISNGFISLGGTDAANVDTLDEWLAAARALVTTNGRVAAFEFGTDTYVFQENTGGDLLVMLYGHTSLTSVSTSAGDNVIWIA
jgi:hypothetical protein